MLIDKIKPAMKRGIFYLHECLPPAIPKMFTGSFVPIFMLHRFDYPEHDINGMSIDTLRTCLNYFQQSGYTGLSLESLSNLLLAGEPLPDKCAVFTIDDGFIDQYKIAGPLFSEFDIPVTYFLITGFIDKQLWPWDDQVAYVIEHANKGKYTLEFGNKYLEINLAGTDADHSQCHKLREFIKTGDNSNLYAEITNMYETFNVPRPSTIPEEYLPMTWDNARELDNLGHKLSAHTITHRILSRLSEFEALNEISGSIERIKEEIKTTSPVFAYPTGRQQDFTQQQYIQLKHNGIRSCVSTTPGSVFMDHKNMLFALPRFGMPDNLTDFVQYLSWIEAFKDKIRSLLN